MTVHQCPKCELRFERKTELDDHCWHDHPQFRHDYPAVAVQPEKTPTPEPADVPPVAKEPVHLGQSLVRWLIPRQRN